MDWVDKRTLLSAILSTAEAGVFQVTPTWSAGIHRALDVSWTAVWDEVLILQKRGALPWGCSPGGIKVK